MHKYMTIVAIAAVVLTCVSGTQADLVMETVPIGNAGNIGEVQSQGTFGSVDYIYHMGQYEVTAGQYTEFLNAVAATDTYGLYNPDMADPTEWTLGCNIQRSGSSGSYTYSAASDWADRPVNCVSWYDTLRFANWMHNGQGSGDTENGAYTMSEGTSVVRNPGATWFLPTEDEWYKSAYHKNDGDTGNYFDYPTSNDTAPGYVNNSGNLSGTGAPFAEGGTDPGNYATFNGDGGTPGIGSPYYRTEVGEWENSDSPYGTFDQGGNVWEWNEALIGSFRGLRGGSYGNDDDVLASSYRYDYLDPDDETIGVGFRVASEVPEPCTLGLLSLGGLMLFKRRR